MKQVLLYIRDSPIAVHCLVSGVKQWTHISFVVTNQRKSSSLLRRNITKHSIRNLFTTLLLFNYKQMWQSSCIHFLRVLIFPQCALFIQYHLKKTYPMTFKLNNAFQSPLSSDRKSPHLFQKVPHLFQKYYLNRLPHSYTSHTNESIVIISK